MKKRAILQGPLALLVAVSVSGLCACDGGGGAGGAGGTTTTTAGGHGGAGGDGGTGGVGGDGGTAGSAGVGGSGGAGGTGGVGGDGGSGGSATAHWTIGSVTSGGSGCPDPDSVELGPGGETTSLSLSYTGMELWYPPGAAVQHTNCAVGLSVDVEPGWQFAGAAVAVHGAATLPADSEARQTTQFFLAGAPGDTTLVIPIAGPWSGAYDMIETLPESSLFWSPCGGSMIFAIDAGLDLHAPAGSQDLSAVDLTSLDVEILWRECQ